MKSREMMDEKGTTAPARSAESEKADAVREAVDALNRAADAADAAGLTVRIDVAMIEYVSGARPLVSATISRAL